MSDTLIDLARVDIEFGEDWDIFQELIFEYENAYGELVGAVRSAIESKNASELKISAHTLKGIVANLYSEPLKKLAFDLEQCGVNGTFDGCEQMLAEFEEMNGKIIALVKEHDHKKAS